MQPRSEKLLHKEADRNFNTILVKCNLSPLSLDLRTVPPHFNTILVKCNLLKKSPFGSKIKQFQYYPS